MQISIDLFMFEFKHLAKESAAAGSAKAEELTSKKTLKELIHHEHVFLLQGG